MRAGSLEIDPLLYEFVAVEALPGTGVQIDEFWSALESILADLGPRNAALTARRDELQAQIDDWHRATRADGRGRDGEAYANFLRDIGYLRYMDGAVATTTANVDPEIAEVAGPQLVVPVDNARYALNAANARWGSLYDALYGTDVLSEADGCSRGDAFNPVRGDKVVAAGREFLDTHFALDSASHAWATGYAVRDGALQVRSGDGTVSALLRPEQFVGYTGGADSPTSVLLRKNGLHCELCIDAEPPGGAPGPRRYLRNPPRVRHHHDHGLRGLRVGCGHRRQSVRLPELARAHAGHAGDDVRSQRDGCEPVTAWRPQLHRPGRLAAHRCPAAR